MRIHDSQNDTVTNNLILFLTEKEATHLIGALEQVLEDDSPATTPTSTTSNTPTNSP